MQAGWAFVKMVTNVTVSVLVIQKRATSSSVCMDCPCFKCLHYRDSNCMYQSLHEAEIAIQSTRKDWSVTFTTSFSSFGLWLSSIIQLVHRLLKVSLSKVTLLSEQHTTNTNKRTCTQRSHKITYSWNDRHHSKGRMLTQILM